MGVIAGVRSFIIESVWRRSGAGATPAEILALRGRRHVGIVVGTLADGDRRTVARGQVDERSIFEIGSITKVLTVLLLARMVEDGAVALDERPFRGQPTTFADLASHTAGLPRPPRGLLLRSMRERRDPYASFGAGELAAAMAAVRVRGRGRIRYSNLGAGLLGNLLALRAGRTYAELVEQEICAPLGLRDTFVAVPAGERDRFVSGHSRTGRPVPHWHFDALAGAGALRSSAADLLAFLAVQLDPPDTALGRAARLTQAPRARRGRLRIGLGWMRVPLRGGGGDLVWHNGGTGGFRSFAGFVPGRGSAAVVLSNCARSTDAIGLQIVRAQASGGR